MFAIKICNFTKYAEREVKSHNKLSYTDVCEEKLCIEVEQRNEQITFATWLGACITFLSLSNPILKAYGCCL